MDKWLLIGLLVGIGLGPLARFNVAGQNLLLLDVIVGVTVVVALAAALYQKTFRWPPKGLMLAWGILMSIFALSWLVAAPSLGSASWPALLFLIRFVVYGTLLIALYPHLSSGRSPLYLRLWLTMFVAVAAGGWLQLGLTPDLRIYEYLGWDPHQGRLVSTWLDPNLVGIFLSSGVGLALLAVPLAATRRDRVVTWLVVGFLIVSVLATLSRSAFIALLIILAVIGWYRYRRVLWLGLGLIILAGVAIPGLRDRLTGAWQLDTTVRYRLESWSEGWQLFTAHPWLGVGYNAIPVARYAAASPGVEVLSDRASSGFDSSLLTIAVAAGGAGLLAWLWWVAAVLRLAWRGWSHHQMVFGSALASVTLALLGASWFVNAWLAAPMLATWWLMIGLCLNEHD
ncbi:TPA: hypothetical protein DHW58_01915 [Patescibacteria group bacterium]|uniref:O-antigen ligase-related domain-containing protein n=2 Tax=Bacteria division Kazan-3B-28 TaxID=1798534 RepID=A0A0G1ZH16_UNCK3|nr:MAG: hypothetical protein VE98_C0001G0535 [candidate division Kazan bacterium GW2011_GWA1_50_15]KKW25778.1 MAG: hypothetical protein VE99_C0001G0417 [candidate division Kazan bacterium GW2011_GWC1_52_13]KKW27207.1 MAG: hypothetical protein VF00_C0001G0142 [candidate division Kazan bacterium GW2011_GWB1_52_7]HCL47727.1 hypothetical protein [Patescibacteria group bacterium]HCR42498.1 hypothetical protein [Patescibacteria group bacterium]